MNIGIDARSLCFKQRGIPVYVYQLLKHISHTIPEARIYAFINTKFEHNESESDYTTRLQDVEALGVILVDIHCETDLLWEQWLLPKTLKKYHIDILHMPANRVSLLANCSQVATIHDTLGWQGLKSPSIKQWLYSPKDSFYHFRRTMLFYLQYTYGLRRVDHVLTISQFSQDDILKRFPHTQGKISFVHHGMPELFSEITKPTPLAMRNFTLMLGGESAHKNPFNMLKAFSLLPIEMKEKFPLRVVGIAPHALSQFSQWVNDLGLLSYVSLEGWVDDTTLLNAFKSARVFIFASKEEGFGFPVIQALSCGTPIITSNADVLLELTQKQFLSADYDDVACLQQHLYSLLSSDSDWNDYSELAFQRAADFTWPKAISHIAKIYINLQKGQPKMTDVKGYGDGSI